MEHFTPFKSKMESEVGGQVGSKHHPSQISGKESLKSESIYSKMYAKSASASVNASVGSSKFPLNERQALHSKDERKEHESESSLASAAQVHEKEKLKRYAEQHQDQDESPLNSHGKQNDKEPEPTSNILRVDAMTQARPTFYRDLQLGSPMDEFVRTKETQVTEYDIERMDAMRRGITLDDNNILWPAVREFNIELGEVKIEDYIRRCWTLDKGWMYFVRLIQTHTTDYAKKYIYEVIFSCPTNDVPVPPVTASVFFVFDAPKYGNIEETIKVSYVLEATRYPHIPGQIPFQQKWLQGICDDKLSVKRRINF